jgi:hypothetical protein
MEKIKELTGNLLCAVLVVAMLSSAFFCLPGAGPSSVSVSELSPALTDNCSNK